MAAGADLKLLGVREGEEAGLVRGETLRDTAGADRAAGERAVPAVGALRRAALRGVTRGEGMLFLTGEALLAATGALLWTTSMSISPVICQKQCH